MSENKHLLTVNRRPYEPLKAKGHPITYEEFKVDQGSV
ncbi:hypothetical protein B4083_3731 [Bacillus cereus]|nr:hypothetical protein B4083_3731 [Bacillus cereus]